MGSCVHVMIALVFAHTLNIEQEKGRSQGYRKRVRETARDKEREDKRAAYSERHV